MEIKSKNNSMLILIDDDDFEKIKEFEWIARKRGDTFYALSIMPKIKNFTGKYFLSMHRIIMQPPAHLKRKTWPAGPWKGLGAEWEVKVEINKKIKYRKGYKYQLFEPAKFQLRYVFPKQNLISQFFEIGSNGIMWVKAGYAWDGPSGPTVDTKNFMRGSLIHDVLYQAIREKLLPPKAREPADMELRDACLEDGMWRIRADWVYSGVRLGGGPAADPKHDKKVLEAP